MSPMYSQQKYFSSLLFHLGYIILSATLSKIKVRKRFFRAMPQKNHFWFYNDSFSQRFKEPSLFLTFYNLKNLLSSQRSGTKVLQMLKFFMEHLDKNFLLWLHEASLFLRVKGSFKKHFQDLKYTTSAQRNTLLSSSWAMCCYFHSLHSWFLLPQRS